MAAQDAGTRKRIWFDPRFAIGLVLVVASIVGVWLLVSSAERSTAVYAARQTLMVGDRVEASDFTLAQVRFDDAVELYVTPATLPQEGLVVTRSIAAGELIPASALGTDAGASVTRIVVDIAGQLAGSVGPGAIVDIWSARETEHGVFGPPSVLVGEASVVRLVESTGFIADGTGQSVEVLIPKGKVAAVLESQANADSLALVPVNQSIGG